MTTDLLNRPDLVSDDTILDTDAFDLDLEVSTQEMTVSPAITSHFFCTPGCTSPGGGSFCSYCC